MEVIFHCQWLLWVWAAWLGDRSAGAQWSEPPGHHRHYLPLLHGDLPAAAPKQGLQKQRHKYDRYTRPVCVGHEPDCRWYKLLENRQLQPAVRWRANRMARHDVAPKSGTSLLGHNAKKTKSAIARIHKHIKKSRLCNKPSIQRSAEQHVCGHDANHAAERAAEGPLPNLNYHTVLSFWNGQ